MKRIARNGLPVLLLAGTTVLLSACTGHTSAGGRSIAGGLPDAGAQLISEFGCGGCHMIPGIRDAKGLVGPPLLLFGRRTYIAGRVPNTVENLRRWLLHPQDIDTETAMPDVGLDEDQARNIAAYLYTLN